jgi:hypothetical protein
MQKYPLNGVPHNLSELENNKMLHPIPTSTIQA